MPAAHQNLLQLCGILSVCLWGLPSLGHCTEDFSSSAVEIYREDSKELLGTGTFVSFTGIILTAKHILVDTEESSTTTNYLLRVQIQEKDSDRYVNANLVAVHPFLDLAVLLGRTGQRPSPLPIATAAMPGVGDTIVLIGHAKGLERKVLYVSKSASVDALDRNGYIVAGRVVDIGTSGGPAIYDGELIGLIQSITPDTTRIVPIASALDYLTLTGIQFKEGYGQKVDHIGTLAAKTLDYEKILVDLQTDVEWTASMVPVYDAGIEGGWPSDVMLEISYTRRRVSQPEFNTLVTVSAKPIFDPKWLDDAPVADFEPFERKDWILADGKPPRTQEFKYFLHDLRRITGVSEDQIGSVLGPFRGFDVTMDVETVVGEGFVADPFQHSICFTIRRAAGDRGLGETATTRGRWCEKPGVTADSEAATSGG